MNENPYTDNKKNIDETFNAYKSIKCLIHNNILNVKYMKYYKAFIAFKLIKRLMHISSIKH